MHEKLPLAPRAAWIELLALCCVLASAQSHAQSLRFFGNGSGDIDRVKIRIDPPGPPADVGAGDMTVEFWLRAASGNNAGAINCGSESGWIFGNVVFDRDRWGLGRSYGISIGGGRLAFGARTQSGRTICGSRNVLDGAWHHVAVQRRRSDGFLWLYVDGLLDAQADGADGDLSYPDNAPVSTSCPGGSCSYSDPFIVLAAEKHDAGSGFPSFKGWLDELRISTALRYSGSSFPVPTAPFDVDATTAALYHFDEGSGTQLTDVTPGNRSPGVLRVGGNPQGPQWSSETPFAQQSARVQLATSTYSVAENGGSVTVSVTRSGSSAPALSVSYATSNGSAASGSDYTATSGTLTWSSGDGSARSIVIPILNDSGSEPAQTFALALSAPNGGTLGSPSVATITINDDDAAPAGTLQFVQSSWNAQEGSGAIALGVSRTNGTNGSTSVSYTVSGTATSGQDYTIASGSLAWSAGDSSVRTINVSVLEDALVEATETVVLSLGNPTNGATLGSPASATLSIIDNDNAGTLRLANNAYAVNEADGSVTLVVTRSGGSSGSVSVAYGSSAGTATAGADFTGVSGTLSWPAGDSSNRTITVPVISDAIVEAEETFSVLLENPGGGATLGAPSSAVVTIRDPAQPPGSLFLDEFARPDASALGNGWIEDAASAFALSAGSVLKSSTADRGRDEMVYRPSSENVLDAEAVVELKLGSSQLGYPHLFVRLQTNALGVGGALQRYVLYITNATNSASIERQVTGSSWTSLTVFSLAPSLNTSDRYRLRLRATGTNPVQLNGVVERFANGAWQTIGQANVTDSSSQRIGSPGSVGFGGLTEGGHRYDNFQRN